MAITNELLELCLRRNYTLCLTYVWASANTKVALMRILMLYLMKLMQTSTEPATKLQVLNKYKIK